MSKGLITAEEARGMVEDIVGMSLKTLSEKMSEDRRSMLADITYAMRHSEPQQRTRKESMRDFGEYIRCLALAGNDLPRAEKIAKDDGNEFVSKALGTSTVSAGGALVPIEMAQEWIENLWAQTVVLELGAQEFPMVGAVEFGRVTSGATAAYRGESANATVSQPTTGSLEMRPRILDILCPSSLQWMRQTGGRGAQFVQSQLMKAAKDKMDSTFLLSDGSANTPKGMLYWRPSANTFNETNAVGTTGASTVAEIVANLGNAIYLLTNGNIPLLSPGWVFSPRTWKRLFTALDADSHPVFRDELKEGKLLGFPFKQTTNVPNTYTAAAGSGAGSDASKVFFADFSSLMVGQTENMEVRTSEHATYTTGGTSYNAFQRGEILTQVTMEHDFAPQQAGSEIATIESVTWGTV
jgi:HK97 family phage major capsid protein